MLDDMIRVLNEIRPKDKQKYILLTEHQYQELYRHIYDLGNRYDLIRSHAPTYNGLEIVIEGSLRHKELLLDELYANMGCSTKPFE